MLEIYFVNYLPYILNNVFYYFNLDPKVFSNALHMDLIPNPGRVPV